jgi:hypothetical protein
MTGDPLLGHNESHYPRFRNDRAVSVQMHRRLAAARSPAHLQEISANLRCPFCATRFRFDPRLGPFEADPPDSLYI